MKSNNRLADLYGKLCTELSKAIIGKGEIELMLMVAIIAGGHILIEGLPGTAKTKLAKTFAAAIGGDYKRIQFTPDMMPADITGFYMYSPDGTSRFIEGPIFANIILADELNRTTPRTQSALLEAMQEYQVTIEGKRYPLARPFIVIATQVPTGGEGTYPLTDVQIDRFLLAVTSEYPSKDEEKQIVSQIDAIDDPDIKRITNLDEIRQMQELPKHVHVAPIIVDYAISIIHALRNDADTAWGPSVRSSIALYKCARVLALIDGRDFVIPDDIKRVSFQVLQHRIRVRAEAEMDEVTAQAVIERTLNAVPVPKMNL